MLSSNISLFSLINFLCICFYVGSSHANKCAETDRLALLQLKDGFVDKRKTLNSWKGEDCCKWKGISCDNLTAHVTNLNLSDSRLEEYATSVYDQEFYSFIDKAMLEWKGEKREYEKNLGLMTIIDLSCNQLTGEIPKSITTLAALTGLNLSRNNLTGFIPDNIGHMKMLESLDLSRNHLCGRMPASFSNLTFLSYMDLSFNNLSGKIPHSTQLQTFDASAYTGNSGLCGPPLPNHCSRDVVSPNGSINKNSTEEDGDEDELITIGFYIALGFGFCFGFWGVCGTLVIKSSWRHGYFQFLNNLNDWICARLIVFMARMKRRFQVQE